MDWIQFFEKDLKRNDDQKFGFNLDHITWES
jgi:hypothetical protein